jgi:hypothetical protein
MKTANEAKNFEDAFEVSGPLEAFLQNVTERIPLHVGNVRVKVTKVDIETNTIWFESIA